MFVLTRALRLWFPGRDDACSGPCYRPLEHGFFVVGFTFLHFDFSVRGEVAEPLHIFSREAFVNCSDKQVFPPDTAKCLRVVKKGQDGLLWFDGLKIVAGSDPLHDRFLRNPA